MVDVPSTVVGSSLRDGREGELGKDERGAGLDMRESSTLNTLPMQCDAGIIMYHITAAFN